MKRYGPAFQGRWPDRINRMSDKLNRWMQRLNRPACTQCGGMGSREAFLDEKWREMVTEAFESEDMIYEEDSGDIFAVESRDFPEETEVESPA